MVFKGQVPNKIMDSTILSQVNTFIYLECQLSYKEMDIISKVIIL